MRSSPLLRRGSPLIFVLAGLLFAVTGGLRVMDNHADSQHFAHPTVTWGRVTDVRVERHRSGRHTHRQVAKAHVSFTSEDGGQHSFWGVTSTTTTPGDRRQVEYDADSPSHARFPGSSQSVSTWDTWSGWIRLGLGVLMVAVGAWGVSRSLRSGPSQQSAQPTPSPYQAGPPPAPAGPVDAPPPAPMPPMPVAPPPPGPAPAPPVQPQAPSAPPPDAAPAGEQAPPAYRLPGHAHQGPGSTPPGSPAPPAR